MVTHLTTVQYFKNLHSKPEGLVKINNVFFFFLKKVKLMNEKNFKTSNTFGK